MTWLVTGGAGYIGAHVVRAFRETGLDVVVLDDLSTGIREIVPGRRPAGGRLGRWTPTRSPGRSREHAVTGVVHLAAKKQVGESVEQPLHYYSENVERPAHRCWQAVLDAGVDRVRLLLLAPRSTAMPDVELVTEETPRAPISPYGETKLVGEWLIRDVATRRRLRLGPALRYFNVAGAGAPELATGASSTSSRWSSRG